MRPDYSAYGWLVCLTTQRNRIQIDANAAYLSVGQNNLDIWEGKLNLSFAF